MKECVNSTGRLKKDLLPAVYFDTSVLIDYLLTDGMEIDLSCLPETERPFQVGETEIEKAIKALLHTEKRIAQVAEIRRKLYEEVKVVPVTSYIGVWELCEWWADATLKQYASEVAGATSIQKKGKKEIGELLRKIYDGSIEKNGGNYSYGEFPNGLQLLFAETSINLSYIEFHGLFGILIAETRNFNIPSRQMDKNQGRYPGGLSLAYFQLGIGDILHLQIAHHLGCSYFASFDSDFFRVNDIIEEAGMKLLRTPQEILSIL